ncbi:DUF72 domain-containing protein [candidate division KSB1 bacterium]|nr:DUF72 domain-containing protein [candidate division KSB1 bacterium]
MSSVPPSRLALVFPQIITFHYFPMTKLEKYQHLIHWGTSTWTYPEWAGIVYHKEYTDKSLKTESLAEYAAYSSFSTVGIDNTFYAPPNPYLLQAYAQHLPKDFRCVSKVWQELTVPQWPKHKRHGTRAGQVNESFLDIDLFLERVLSVYARYFRDNLGPFLFEFGYIPAQIMSEDMFFAKLDGFFRELPNDFQYALEIRNKNFLKREYFNVLRRHKVAHVFNHWSYMPALRAQARAAGENPFTADFTVARLLTPLHVGYEKSVEMQSPYDSIKTRLPQMRSDVEELIEQALDYNIPFYVITNNRSEGCAPLTISEMDAMLQEKYAHQS